MSGNSSIEGALIRWGDRLFYPGNRVVKAGQAPRLRDDSRRQRAAAIRKRIEATVVRRAPQVMVKVTGGGRGMKAIAAHFRYISKNGRLEIEDQRGETMRGKDCLSDLADEWRLGGTLIPEDTEPGHRREAHNIMLSMPRGTDPLIVLRAAREFAQAELAYHKYVMVLHDHQANPHVHISVRAESSRGRRLNPRKADLHRWRETFAEKLREWGIEAEATRQSTRCELRSYSDLWRIKAGADGRLIKSRLGSAANVKALATRAEAKRCWRLMGQALLESQDEADRRLGRTVLNFAEQLQPRSVYREARQDRATR